MLFLVFVVYILVVAFCYSWQMSFVFGVCFFFVVKQKTAYEMRISDWSSDVFSSDLDRFIDGHTPFATKHGVKGAEFENVLVVVGRGWNKYNFAQMLEWIDAGPPPDKLEFFENNRNLFYVACSRPKVQIGRADV